jgi:hypothetical protein
VKVKKSNTPIKTVVDDMNLGITAHCVEHSWTIRGLYMSVREVTSGANGQRTHAFNIRYGDNISISFTGAGTDIAENGDQVYWEANNMTTSIVGEHVHLEQIIETHSFVGRVLELIERTSSDMSFSAVLGLIKNLSIQYVQSMEDFSDETESEEFSPDL